MLPLNVCRGIGQDKQIIWAQKGDYFLKHNIKHLFLVLKRSFSSRRLFWVPTTYVLVKE